MPSIDANKQTAVVTTPDITIADYSNISERTMIEDVMNKSQSRIANELKRLSGLRGEAQRLRDNTASMDFDETIADMFEVIRSIESQLSNVLNINTLMERELIEAKDRIVDLKQQRDQLQKQISHLEEEIPSKRELQMLIDQLFEERSTAEQRLRNLQRLTDQSTKALQEKEKYITELASKHKDCLAEIRFLETQLTAAIDKTKQANERLILLEGQIMANRERIQELERDLQLTIEEKLEATRALREFHRSK